MLGRLLLALMVAVVYAATAVAPCASGERLAEVRVAARAAAHPVAQVGPPCPCGCHHRPAASPVAKLAPHLIGAAALAAAPSPARSGDAAPTRHPPTAPTDLPEPVPLVA